jgi:hypothetical protein
MEAPSVDAEAGRRLTGTSLTCQRVRLLACRLEQGPKRFTYQNRYSHHFSLSSSLV